MEAAPQFPSAGMAFSHLSLPRVLILQASGSAGCCSFSPSCLNCWHRFWAGDSAADKGEMVRLCMELTTSPLFAVTLFLPLYSTPKLTWDFYVMVTFSLETILSSQKSYKNATKIPHISFTQIYLSLTFTPFALSLPTHTLSTHKYNYFLWVIWE